METSNEKILYAASTAGHLKSFHVPYLRALMERGDRVITAAAGNMDFLPAAERMELPFTKRYLAPGNFRAALRLASFLRREHPDRILTHTTLAAFFTRLAVRLAGKGSCRVINVVHGYLFDEDSSFLRRMVLLAAEKLMAGVTDEILTMNARDTEIARKHRLCRGSVMQVPGMGLDMTRFSPASAAEKWAARAQLGIPENSFVLLYAAEFSSRKNQAMLLRAMALLPEDVVLLLPGRGELLEDCRQQAKNLGLTERVFFPGFVTELRPWLQAADLGVSSSRSEGLPFNVMEVMASGLPCVLSGVKGHEDLLSEGRCGFFYRFNDENAFVRAVLRLKQDETLRCKMGAAARMRAADFSLERAFAEIMIGYGKRPRPDRGE